MSKALGLPGLRIGWLASQSKEALTLIGNYKHYSLFTLGLGLSVDGPPMREDISIHGIIQRTWLLLMTFWQNSAIYCVECPVVGCGGLMHMKGDVDIDHFAQATRE